MNQSSSQKLLKRGQNTPKTLKTTVFSSKSLYFEAQNIYNLTKKGWYAEQLMEYNELNRSIKILGRKSCKKGLLRAKFAKNGQKWPTKPTLGL